VGTLVYGSPGAEFTFDDRTLMHLQIVITSKLRRGEGFIFSWKDLDETRFGRMSLWIHTSSSLQYRFTGSRLPVINRLWIEDLSASANSGGGMFLSPEPLSPPAASRPG
jgi:hypothetical protein